MSNLKVAWIVLAVSVLMGCYATISMATTALDNPDMNMGHAAHSN
jgi:hypothetical protein